MTDSPSYPDIVERLRNVMPSSLNDAIRTMEDAAQEIERLRPLAQAGKVPAGDFYLVPREIIDQFPEININNYGHDDACALNAWGCEVVTNANPAGSPAVSSTDGGGGK